jgi:hypothetical protein
MDWATWREEPGHDSGHYWRKERALPTKKGFGQRTQEKQQIRETCRRPNRLNLYDLTTLPPCRSNFFALSPKNQTGFAGLNRIGDQESGKSC